MLISTADAFRRLVLDARGPVVVDFSSPHCPPCRALEPLLRECAGRWPHVAVYEVDVDATPELAAPYQIRAVPTLLRFNDGTPNGVQVGLRGRAQLTELFAGAAT